MYIGGVEIEQSQNIKLLGIDIDSWLNYSNQISDLCKRTSQHIGVLTKLTYCSTVWHYVERQTDANWKGYRRELCALYLTTDQTSYDNLLQRVNLTTVYNRRLRDIVILMFKAKNKLLPKSLQGLFNLQDEGEKRYITRNSDFLMPRFNIIKYGKHSVSYLGPFLLSKLTKKGRNKIVWMFLNVW